MRTSLLMVSALALAGSLLSGCRIERTGESSAVPADTGSGGAAAVDPVERVASSWTSEILPYLQGKAGEFEAVRAQMEASPDEAGRQHGHRQKDEGTPWNIVIRASGEIIEANTKSRAATAGVDVDGDGQVDLMAQLGPVIRGTSIRDVLDFVRFEDFSNQITYANYGKALNSRVDEDVLSNLPREDLVGKKMTLMGVFTADKPGSPPLVTPVEATIE
jgi:predicted lipoprotein